jgi:heparosan-N-sulfate-glucuronate 5-epimerase
MTIAATLNRAARAFPVDWSPRRRYRLCNPHAQELGPYYIRWSGGRDALGEEWEGAPFDNNGVLLSLPQRLYHATRIAQYALEQHARWGETGDPRPKQRFLAQAAWLRDHQVFRNGMRGCYPHPFAWPAYGAEAGFLSAMTQGEAISVLLRAHEVAGDVGYVQAAAAAAEPFRREIAQGGVVWREGDDVYLEEAAGVLPSRILNGWIYALWGLFELTRYCRPTWIGELYDQSLATLQRRLPLYDSGHWSYYNLLATRSGFRKLATLKYHAFHVAQLRVLASMTGRAAFGTTAVRWESYTKSAESRLRVWANAFASLPRVFWSRADTIPGGARAIV